MNNEAKLIKDLADILDEAGLTELEYETETVAIRLSRVAGTAPIAAVQPVPEAPLPATTNQREPAEPENPADHPGARGPVDGGQLRRSHRWNHRQAGAHPVP